MFRKVSIISAAFLFFGILIGFVGFPMLFTSMLKNQVTLKPNTHTRQMWEKLPFSLNFSIYVFNVTNPIEVQSGGKPAVQEIGPFVFEEWKDKYNIEDNDANDTVSFNMRNTFIFRPDLGLSGDEIITMPHPLVQVMSLAIKRDRAAMISAISEGLQELFHPTSPFITAKFMDLFFHGIDIDCSNQNFKVQMICLNFHTESVKGAVKVNETFFKFSLMGANNHSNAGQFTVSRGIKNFGTLGKVLEFDGEQELSNWNGEKCNTIRGTDSTIFSPLMNRDEALVAFLADLCRSLAPKFEYDTHYNGIPALHYTLTFGDVKNEPDSNCYCKSYPDNCPPQGTLDLSPCNDAPMFASQPHFFKADRNLLNNVDGLCPCEERHQIYIDYEIISGTPLSFARRLQFNLDVQPIPEFDVMKNMRALLMPLFWVEERGDIGPKLTQMLKNKIFLTQKINNAFKWSAIVVGSLGCLISCYLFYANKKYLKSTKN